MKKYLIPKEGKYYKANMHCHSHLSDGAASPEEIKKHYVNHGFSIVAFTDHDILIPHQDLADEHFLPLNGCEIEVNAPGATVWREMKTCHICCVALNPDNLYQVCYHRDGRYLYGNAVHQKKQLSIDESRPNFVREYSHAGVSAMMKEARDNGFFVTYNHPHSSLESYPDYMGYEHMHALEIYNACGANGGYYDYCPQVYDDILKSGKRILAIAGDDMHGLSQGGTCQGFTMIKADKLEYRTITDALVKGNFYASQGPLIDELWIEDDTMHITCPSAEKIVFTVGNRREWKAVYAEGDKILTHAEYQIKPDHSYIRVTVFDKYGKAANTNAYFVDELKIW